MRSAAASESRPLEAAQLAFEGGRLDDARAALAPALEDPKQRGAALIVLAMLERSLGRPAQARAALAKAEKEPSTPRSRPELERAWQALAWTPERATGEFARAARAAAAAKRADTGRTAALALVQLLPPGAGAERARAAAAALAPYARGGAPDEALAALASLAPERDLDAAARFWSAAAEHKDAGAFPHAQLARLAWRRGRAAEAEASLRRAAAISPAFALELVDHLRARGLTKQAERAAAAIDPKLPEADLARARLAFDAGRWKEAHAAYDSARRDVDLSPEAVVGSARSLWRLGEKTRAVDELEAIARVSNPGEPQPWGWFAVGALAAGDPRKAGALGMLGGPLLSSARAAALAGAGRPPDRGTAFVLGDRLSQAALARSPYDGRLRVERARELVWQGRRAEALEQVRRAKALGFRSVERDELERDLLAEPEAGPEARL